MTIGHQRLDKVISEYLNISRKNIRLVVAQKRVSVDGKVSLDVAQIVNKFSIIQVDNKFIQNVKPLYLMMNKPVGVVSATIDAKHKTVIDVIQALGILSKNEILELHIVGRLDLNTSGLLLLTNDSRWSERLMSPDKKVEKRYHVQLRNALTSDYIEAFKQGMYFEYEDITTKPVDLKITAEKEAEVILTEGRYHQIKRMFGRFRNEVLALKRISIGTLQLSDELQLGDAILLTQNQADNI